MSATAIATLGGNSLIDTQDAFNTARSFASTFKHNQESHEMSESTKRVQHHRKLREEMTNNANASYQNTAKLYSQNGNQLRQLAG